jgi:HK97 gp10 family phage protein
MGSIIAAVARVAITVAVRVVVQAVRLGVRAAFGGDGGRGRGGGITLPRVTAAVKLDSRFPWAKREMHRALAEALDAAADTAVRSAKRRAPVRTGALRASIGRTAVERSRNSYRVAITAGVGLDYAAVVEFGGIYTPAQAFIRPAARSGKKRVVREVKERTKHPR